MRYLYIDNFRGFSKTIIPLHRVNFFVGENSTGKTSILGLINLINSSEFWLRQDFNSLYHKFGMFDDLISLNSTNKKCFSLGYCIKKEKEEFGFDLFQFATFINHEGYPKAKDYSSIWENQLVSFKHSKNCLMFRIDKIDEIDVSELFIKIQELHYGNSKGYKKIKLDKQVLLPPKFLEMIIHVSGIRNGNLKDNLINTFGLIQSKSKSKDDGNKTDESQLMPSDIDVEKLTDDSVLKLLYDFSSIKNHIKQLVFFAPIRSKPERIYYGCEHVFSPDCKHTPYLLQEHLDNIKENEEDLNLINSFGYESGLFKEIFISNIYDQAGSPFEIKILQADKELRINQVGYGVSQILPLIIEILVRQKGIQFAIQQPEVHLHPKAQAAFGAFIFKVARAEQKLFFIETHSDYTIDRFRIEYSKDQEKDFKSQVVFFEKILNGNKAHVIEILSNGKYPDSQPKQFREFFINETLELLEL